MNQAQNTSTLQNEPPLVIHILTSLDFGGVERRMEVIASVLDHARMRHQFVAIGRGGAADEKLRALGAEVRCLGQKTNIPSLGAFKTLLKLFQREHPLVVHTHGAEANFHGLLAAWLARVPVRIGEEIGIPSHGAKAKTVFRWVYGTAHRVIGISQAVTQWLIASCEVPQQKATWIYNPVLMPTLSQHTSPPHNIFRIGFVGRFEAVKNPCALLDAFLRLRTSDIHGELWFIGDGSERAVLERCISKHGLAHQVRLWGYQADPASLIRQCHVYVQPSVSEGFGIALVEAMGCDVPVIATAVGGAPEIIDHGKTGWLLPQPSPELIAAALKEAWQLGPEHLREMGRRARQSVEGRFEPLPYLERLEDLYQQLAG